MKRFIFILLIVFFLNSMAFAKPNVFCKNEESLDDFCMVAANVMYEGYMKGFTGSAKKYTKGENWDDKTILKEAQELIPYNIFHSAFLFCGESQKDMVQGQKCLIKELQKYIIVKFDQNSATEPQT